MTIEPRFAEVKCLSPAGFHAMAYAEWGDPKSPDAVICVHGLGRVGRDFDYLARKLAPRWRVICPDVAGRGRSEWLRDPRFYTVPQYAADMVALIARLDVAQVSWVGTSMGGQIGLALAGQAGSPLRRLVLNDVGPRVGEAAIKRITEYFGAPVRFADIDQATDYIATISKSFGLTTRAEWRSITETAIRRDGDAWVLHYDPAIAQLVRAVTPEQIAGAETAMWALYDQIKCPTLVLRGAESDLLSRATTDEMAQRGPRASVVEFAGVGHAPMLMNDEQADAVARFLDGAD